MKNVLTDTIEFLVIENSRTKTKDIQKKKVTYLDLLNSLNVDANMNNTGEKGEPGETGQIGEKGSKGDVGAKGMQGYRGLTGPTGWHGQSGLDGENGIPGPIGDTGSKGKKGEKGILGKYGEKGPRGEYGEIGNDGETGVHGSVGSKGEPGETGLPGVLIKGIKGRKGVKGYGKPGDFGEKGGKGEVGLKGNKGIKGSVGQSNNVIVNSISKDGTEWVLENEDILGLDIKEEMNNENSRKLLKVKRGIYYDRFFLNKDAFCILGMQFYDPLKNSYSPINQYIYDSHTQKNLPLLLITQEKNRTQIINSSRVYSNNVNLVCKIFYEGVSQMIPFSTWSCDVY